MSWARLRHYTIDVSKFTGVCCKQGVRAFIIAHVTGLVLCRSRVTIMTFPGHGALMCCNAVRVYTSRMPNATVYEFAWLVAGYIRGEVCGSRWKLPARHM